VHLDELDRQIIAALQTDGRKPFTMIATELGVSEGVVRYRVQRLVKEEIMQVVGVADPLKIGFDFMVMVGVRTEPAKAQSIAKQIATFPETSYVARVTGNVDILVEVVCRNTAHFNRFLNEKLHTLDGIISTESSMILDIQKMAYGWTVTSGDPAVLQATASREDNNRDT
jgi:Lrp/AsnC family transcriptional regulator for asnA, asnC and gidA